MEYARVAALREALGCAEPLAWTLVRRGLDDPEEARAFLAADGPLDPPTDLPGVAQAADRLSRAIAAGENVVIHGDYDCDGISSTAMLARALRARGGKVTTFLPSRFTDGYGVSMATVERLADEGARLLVCVDCGTTATDELTRAHDLGLDTIVLDHHLAAGARPPGILVNPALGRPSDALPSAAGVVLKVTRRLAELDPPGTLGAGAGAEIDLAALATVADAVPLRGENRRVVAQGIAAIREHPRPGIRALLAAAGQDPQTVDARTLGFTIGPAINAAGRIDHPDTALGLLLETDAEVARPVAERLWNLNMERREIERAITDEAIAQFEASPPEHREAAAIVVGGEGWHEGVVGIVASRLTDRYERPAVVISIDGADAKGSGRSVPGVDLHGLVSRSDAVLTRWGGHEGAVGLSLARDDIPAFRDALSQAAEGERHAIERSRVRAVDTVVGGADLSLAGAEAFEALAPYGRGNPAVSMLIPGVALSGVGTMGADGRHLQVGFRAGGVRARAVAFSQGHRAPGIDPDARHDLVAGLSIERWQETVAPRVTLRGLDRLDERPPEQAQGLRAALSAAAPLRPIRELVLADRRAEADEDPAGPEIAPGRIVDARGAGALSRVIALSAADGGVLVVSAHAARREVALAGVLAPRRLGIERVAVLSADREPAAALEVIEDPRGGPLLALADYGALHAFAPRADLHVVALDPPTDPAQTSALTRQGAESWLHLVWGPEERAFTRDVLFERTDLRELARLCWQPLQSAQEGGWDALQEALVPIIERAGLAATTAALCALNEAGLCVADAAGMRIVPGAPRADLTRTPAAEAAAARRRAGEAYLERVDTIDVAARAVVGAAPA